MFTGRYIRLSLDVRCCAGCRSIAFGHAVDGHIAGGPLDQLFALANRSINRQTPDQSVADQRLLSHCPTDVPRVMLANVGN